MTGTTQKWVRRESNGNLFIGSKMTAANLMNKTELGRIVIVTTRRKLLKRGTLRMNAQLVSLQPNSSKTIKINYKNKTVRMMTGLVSVRGQINSKVVLMAGSVLPLGEIS